MAYVYRTNLCRKSATSATQQPSTLKPNWKWSMLLDNWQGHINMYAHSHQQITYVCLNLLRLHKFITDSVMVLNNIGFLLFTCQQSECHIWDRKTISIRSLPLCIHAPANIWVGTVNKTKTNLYCTFTCVSESPKRNIFGQDFSICTDWQQKPRVKESLLMFTLDEQFHECRKWVNIDW